MEPSKNELEASVMSDRQLAERTYVLLADLMDILEPLKGMAQAIPTGGLRGAMLPPGVKEAARKLQAQPVNGARIG